MSSRPLGNAALINIGSLAVCPNTNSQDEIGIINDAAISWENGVITFVGKESDLLTNNDTKKIDAKRAFVVPGLIDCHTHLAFAGWREREFSMRILGNSYLEIEQAGGGIVSTVEKTRAASLVELKERCHGFLKAMLRKGVTSLEAKSGYGLSLESEIKLLNVYAELKNESVQTIVPTFLGAHTFPKEYKQDHASYIKIIMQQMLPQVAAGKLATFCDIFVEKSAFSEADAEMILGRAKELGFKIKLHADQFSDSSGAKLACKFKATSADHLECTDDAGAALLAEANVIAVMLPLASLYTNQKAADARKFINAGCRLAVATDFNPGSAPSFDLPLAMFLGCTLNRLTPAEALKAATINAAVAIGIEDRCGSLQVGKEADLVLIDANSVEDWMYHQRDNRIAKVFKKGVQV